MQTEPKDRKISTRKKTGGPGADADRRQPHERDESPDGRDVSGGRGVMQQAADDIAQGLVDTDCRATPGVEQASKPAGPSGQARPRENAHEGMRHNTAKRDRP